jgi:hypothetical protein
MSSVALAIEALDGPLLLDVKLPHDEPAPYFRQGWADQAQAVPQP